MTERVFDQLSEEQKDAVDAYLEALGALYLTPPWSPVQQSYVDADSVAFASLAESGALEVYAAAAGEGEAQG